jgi:antibiotic biosynthesis monooxygenase (ABM) superfamily enzyme
LFADPSEHRVRGIEGWFGAVGARPPRWKQAIWLAAFFPVSLLFNFVLGPLLSELALAPRVLVSTLALTPLMVYGFIPLSTHLLANWLHPRRHRAKPPKRLLEYRGARSLV